MDRALRNTLRLAVGRCRTLLEADYLQQLQSQFGIYEDGRVADEATLPQLDAQGLQHRREIVAALEHLRAGGASPAEAVAQYVRESAFSTLNRLAAIKLMEAPERRLVPESLGQGTASRGFRQFLRLSPEAVRAEPDGGYRLYLELLCEDLSGEIGVLFDLNLPQGILFPSERTLNAVLHELNAPDLNPVWCEDETLGWIYQYFTPKEQRDEARKVSAAPRNAYELAFRNQFYTPRYVVEFLVDNTLGRIWYEMRRGDTELVDRCRYLICRKHPIFLGPGEAEPPAIQADAAGEYDTEIIPHRPKRDPRSLRVLDPACGSGHFLLYCFDLLMTIYMEAWHDPELGPALRRDYPDEATFRRDVPRLILLHNLHGIDIDLRAVQIAQLALWLRAQREYAALGLRPAERPPVTRVNVVAAEALPGDREMLDEFVRTLEPAPLGDIVLDVWDHMTGIGEIGSLFKAERLIQRVVAEAKREWQSGRLFTQITLFEPAVAPRQVDLDLSFINDEEFWRGAEQAVFEALRRYAESAPTHARYRRRLFADDAAQGFALLELFVEPFDVVLMNPPFGAASPGAKAYIEREYPRTKNDLYAAFVERGLEVLRPRGMLGAITSRTGFFLISFRRWREEVLLQEARLTAMADLGYGVLDTATVETAAYCLEKVG